MLLARLNSGLAGASLSGTEAPGLLTARQALELATRGGAAVLGRSDLGSLETGKCADFFGVRLDALDYAGALHDPVAAIVFCQPRRVDTTVVHGKKIVENGHILTIDLPHLIEKHNQAAARLVNA
jgi:cytosine/adenosine deaminase-related metal-dependent hydrolase